MGRGALTLDTMNYKIMYDNSYYASMSDSYEKGFLLLQKAGWWFNFDYPTFRTIVTAISLFLIYSTLVKLKANVFYVFLFYLSFAVFIDTVQIRNFFAFSVVIFGLRYLTIKTNSSTYKFLLSIFIASSIHISSIIYLLLLLVNYKNLKSIIKPIIFLTITLCFIIFLLGNKVPFLNEIMYSLDGGERLEGYTSGVTQFGFLYPIIIHLFNLFLIYKAYRIIVNKNDLNLKSFRSKEYINFIKNVFFIILWINIITILFFPLYMYNVQFIRLTRNLIFINLLAFSLIQAPLLKLSFKVIILNMGVILSMAFWFYFTFIVQNHIDDVIIPFFEIESIM